jgi:hypothetical protein
MNDDLRPRRIEFDDEVRTSTGLRQTGGFVYEEQLSELVGQKGAKIYREMSDNDGTVGAVLFAITMLVRQSMFTVTATDESPEAEELKLFVEQVLFEDMSVAFSDVVGEICTMFQYGYAPMEIVYKRRNGAKGMSAGKSSKFDDGRIGIRSIRLLGQTSIVKWEIDLEDDSIDGLWQQPLNRGQVFLPIEKMLLFRTTAERNNPEGRSILRNAYTSWFYKTKIQNFEAMGVERDLVGLPVVTAPSRIMSRDAEEDDKRQYAALKSLVTSIRRDKKEGVVLPSDRDQSGNLLYELKLLSTGGSRTFDTSKIIDRYDRAIATSVLADFIFLGQQAVGSFALSSDKTALFATAIGAFMKIIADTFNRHLLPRLWQLNGFDPSLMPTIKAGDLENQNIAEVADFISKLSSAGMTVFPDRELENRLRQMAGLPEAPEDGLEDGGDNFGAGDVGDDEDDDEDTSDEA